MTQRVFRLDRFTVPVSGREEFLEQVRRTHQVLRGLPGFIEDVVLERAAGASRFSIVTLVIWESQQAVDDARVAVAVAHRKAGFDRHQMLSRLGIEADVANYHETEVFTPSRMVATRSGRLRER
jgi:heme-degrading monooxygenase HmoA